MAKVEVVGGVLQVNGSPVGGGGGYDYTLSDGDEIDTVISSPASDIKILIPANSTVNVTAGNELGWSTYNNVSFIGEDRDSSILNIVHNGSTVAVDTGTGWRFNNLTIQGVATSTGFSAYALSYLIQASNQMYYDNCRFTFTATPTGGTHTQYIFGATTAHEEIFVNNCIYEYPGASASNDRLGLCMFENSSSTKNLHIMGLFINTKGTGIPYTASTQFFIRVREGRSISINGTHTDQASRIYGTVAAHSSAYNLGAIYIDSDLGGSAPGEGGIQITDCQGIDIGLKETPMAFLSNLSRCSIHLYDASNAGHGTSSVSNCFAEDIYLQGNTVKLSNISATTTFTIGSAYTQITNCTFSSSVAGTYAVNELYFSNTHFLNTAVTISGNNSQVSNCRFYGAVTISGSQNKLSNCYVVTNLSVDGDENTFNGGYIGGVVDFGGTAQGCGLFAAQVAGGGGGDSVTNTSNGNHSVGLCRLAGAVNAGGGSIVTTANY